MRKFQILFILATLIMLSACDMSLPGNSNTIGKTPTSQPAEPLPQNNDAEAQPPNILGKWAIEQTQPLTGHYYGISTGGSSYSLRYTFQIGDEGEQIEFTRGAMIYDAVAYNYEWVDDRRIKLAVNIGVVGNVWLVYDVKLDGGKLLLLDDRDESILSTFSRSSGVKPVIKTKTPAVLIPTKSSMGEFPFGELAAIDYSYTDWQYQDRKLMNLSLADCSIQQGGATEADPNNTVQIGPFQWLIGYDGSYTPIAGGEAHLIVQLGSKKAACKKVVEDLLKTTHEYSKYAQSGECRYAPKQQLKVGDTAQVLSSSYLRTKPIWSAETQVRLVKPSDKLTSQITGGPVCAIYDKGEYSYWQVELSSGEKGWMAEGDLKEYYLARKK